MSLRAGLLALLLLAAPAMAQEPAQEPPPEGPLAAPAPPPAPRVAGEEPAAADAPAGPAAPDPDTSDPVRRSPTPGPVALMRGLDKYSGRVETFEVPVGGVADYARLLIAVRACEASEDGPRAHVEIVDRMRADSVAFLGWMFADDPSLSALDHARYDVWLLACSTASRDAS